MKHQTYFISFAAFFCLSLFSSLLVAEPNVLLKDQDNVVLRNGLLRSRIHFEREKSGRVVFLGGSITAGGGWRDLIGASIKKRFPAVQFDLINAGIPSLGSTPGAFRFERDVLARGAVDLLFIDAAVNDEVNGFSATEQTRGMEGIVRHARMANPNIDIVIMHFATEKMVEQYSKNTRPDVIANHEAVAERYGIPTVDMPREMARGIAAGEYTLAQWGGIHPSAFGHELYAKQIDKLLDRAWASRISNDDASKPHPLPDPVDEKSYARGRFLEVKNAQLGDGWTLDPAWKPTEKIETRGGFVNVPMVISDKPGATMTLKFEGTAIGIFVVSGPDAGVVEYSIDSAPFRSRDLNTGWSKSLHLPWAVMLDGDLKPGAHELTLRPAPAVSAARGTAIRIVHFLVNAPASR